MAFLDGHARTVPLKEAWKLKWNNDWTDTDVTLPPVTSSAAPAAVSAGSLPATTPRATSRPPRRGVLADPPPDLLA